MGAPWPVDATVRAARTRILTVEVRAGFHGVSVDADGDQLLIIFRWKENRSTFAVRLDLPTSPESPLTGEDVDSPDEWARDVGWLLTEELGTGFVSGARRVRHDDHIELIHPAPSGSLRPPYTLTQLHTEPGALSRLFRGPTPARRALVQQRLITALEVHETAHDRKVGQAVVAWARGRDGVAELEVAEAPEAAFTYLVQHTLHSAANAGAASVTTTLSHPTLSVLGFRPSPVPVEWVLRTADLAPVDPL